MLLFLAARVELQAIGPASDSPEGAKRAGARESDASQPSSSSNRCSSPCAESASQDVQSPSVQPSLGWFSGAAGRL